MNPRSLTQDSLATLCGWIACSLAATLVACSGSEPPPVLPLTGTFVVGPELNPDRDGRPSPVFVRVYQLKDRAAFLAATFQQLERNDEQMLGADLLHKELLEFCPGAETEPGAAGAEPAAATETGANAEEGAAAVRSHSECRKGSTTLTMELQPGARYIAAFAEFYDVRDPKGNWRAIVQVPGVDDPMFGGPRLPNFTISLKRTTLSLAFE